MVGILDTKEGANALQRNQQFFEKGVGDTTVGSRLLGAITGTDISPSKRITSETSRLDPISREIYNVVAPYGKLALNIADTVFRLPGAAAADIANMFGVKEKDVNEIQALTNSVIFQSFGQGPRVVGAGSQIKNVAKNVVDEATVTAKNFPNYTPFKNIEPKSVGAMSIDDLIKSKPKIKSTNKIGEELTKPLEEMVNKGITKNMTLPEIQQYLKDNYNVSVTTTNIYSRLNKLGKENFKPLKNINSGEVVRNALLNLESLENVTLQQLKNIPEIKKLNLTDTALRAAVANARKSNGLENFKISKAKSQNFIEKLASEGKINKQELDNFLEANPSISNPKLLEEFPILKNFDRQSIMRYRRQKGASTRDNPETPPKIQLIKNPTLDVRLNYVRNIEELYGNNINDKTIKVIRAHALGEGKVIDLDPKDIVALENKIKYIPENFIDDSIKRPTFFLTSSGNDAHRVIENNLINTLVDKYQKLGYKFVDNPKMPWTPPKKEIDLSLPKNKDLAIEIQNLNKKIDGFKKDLSDMDAFTLFYNPIKNKIISYGKPVSEVPGLANIVTRIKKGELDLKDGGLVGIDRMTRSLREF
jgi:hypothetical protein